MKCHSMNFQPRASRASADAPPLPPEAAEVFEGAGAIRNWSMTLVFDEVVPALREMGVMDDAAFNTIFVENPARWLTA